MDEKRRRVKDKVIEDLRAGNELYGDDGSEHKIFSWLRGYRKRKEKKRKMLK